MSQPNRELLLWPDGVAPGVPDAAPDAMPVERMGESPFGGIVRYNVTRPRLEVIAATGVANGAAAIIGPGGGFHFLTMDNEGYALADVLAPLGVTCFVLSYRLIPTPADGEAAKAATFAAFMDGANRIEPFVAPILPDGPQAVRVVREHASELGVDPGKIAMIGFSAGARVTATAMLDGAADARPDAAAIIYLPSMPAHDVPADAPPLFVLAAIDDQIGIAGNEDLYRSWRRAGRPVELHLYERGGHGFGMRPQGLPLDRWSMLLVDWLRSHGFAA